MFVAVHSRTKIFALGALGDEKYKNGKNEGNNASMLQSEVRNLSARAASRPPT